MSGQNALFISKMSILVQHFFAPLLVYAIQRLTRFKHRDFRWSNVFLGGGWGGVLALLCGLTNSGVRLMLRQSVCCCCASCLISLQVPPAGVVVFLFSFGRTSYCPVILHFSKSVGEHCQSSLPRLHGWCKGSVARVTRPFSRPLNETDKLPCFLIAMSLEGGISDLCVWNVEAVNWVGGVQFFVHFKPVWLWNCLGLFSVHWRG